MPSLARPDINDSGTATTELWSANKIDSELTSAATAAVLNADFDATTFLYATSDDTPQAKTPAQVRTILNVTQQELSINDQTGTTYTLVIGDAQAYVRCSNGSAITLTVPPNASVAFPIGTQVLITQVGAGVLTVAAGGGVTINGDLVITAQYKGASLLKVAEDVWDIHGSIGS